MRSETTASGAVLLLVASVLFAVVGCQGAAVSWTNLAGGNWTDPANWNTSALPTSNDTVYINLPTNVSAGTFNVRLNGASVAVAGLYLAIPPGEGTVRYVEISN